MRLEWRSSGAKLTGLRGRDREIEECTFHGAKDKSFFLRAKVKEVRSGNRVIEEASEIVIEKRGALQRTLRRKPKQAS